MRADPTRIVVILLMGLVAGWLAGRVLGGGGFLKYILWGLLGSVVGSVLFPALGIRMRLGHPIIEMILTAAAGAIVVVLIARIIA